jgi:hypothetical protein
VVGFGLDDESVVTLFDFNLFDIFPRVEEGSGDPHPLRCDLQFCGHRFTPCGVLLLKIRIPQMSPGSIEGLMAV